MNTLKTICKYTTSRKMSPTCRRTVFLLSSFVSTGGFIGKIKYMSGTFGSLLGIIFGLFFVKISLLHQIILLGLILSIGTLSTHMYLIKIDDLKADPKEVVIDEIFAVLLTCFFARLITPKLGFENFLSIFILFRTFDIIKPYPISWVDKNIHGAKGIMFDDILASFASILVYICVYM